MWIFGALAFLTVLSAQDREAQDREEMSPRQEYRSYFLGTYAPQKQCTEPDALWTFAANSISEGRLACDINDITKTDEGMLVVRTKDCTRAGKPVAAMTYRLDLASNRAIKVQDGKRRILVKRCPGF